MPKIISIEGTKVKIGSEDGEVQIAPIASLTFSNPKVGDQVEVFKDGSNIIVNRVSSRKKDIKKIKINKKAFFVGGSIIGAAVLLICAIRFLPLAFDEDLRSQSSYPKYFGNLKEEKDAFIKALQSCNSAAESKMRSNGVTVEYSETDLNVVSKGVDEEDGSPYIYFNRVNPTGGDTEYKTYGTRYYNCETNIDGNNVKNVYILWNEKD